MAYFIRQALSHPRGCRPGPYVGPLDCVLTSCCSVCDLVCSQLNALLLGSGGYNLLFMPFLVCQVHAANLSFLCDFYRVCQPMLLARAYIKSDHPYDFEFRLPPELLQDGGN